MSHSQKPVSFKQLAANRNNAALSTGPSTPEGKARSSQNTRKHGFTASTFAVVRLEDLQEIAAYQPVNSQELFAVERMALAEGFHRLARQANSWSLFLRYQAQAERLYRRAVEEFEGLKPCAMNYRMNPFSKANLNQTKLLIPLSKRTHQHREIRLLRLRHKPLARLCMSLQVAPRPATPRATSP